MDAPAPKSVEGPFPVGGNSLFMMMYAGVEVPLDLNHAAALACSSMVRIPKWSAASDISKVGKFTAQELRKLDTSLNATYQKVRRWKDILSGNDLSSLL